jgi:DNA repair protein RecN (Recombination protein N)
MLCELRVKNLALIESLELSFEEKENSGLVVMTGETGAGKSIMLRAIHLLSGRRGTTDWIRSGEENCEVEALFEINPNHQRLLQKLLDGGFGEETSLVIKRVLSLAGRSRYYVNGSIATGRIVAELSVELLNIASQHDQQQLLQRSMHLDFLDTLGDHWAERLELREQFNVWQESREQLAKMRVQEQEKEQRQDFLRLQIQEIRDIDPEKEEDERLKAEKKRLKNSQTLIELSQASYRLLSGDLLDSLGKLRQKMTQLAVIDPSAAKLSEDISGYTFLAEDYMGELRAYKSALDTDPYRLDQVNERLDILSQLKRKYGETVDQVLDFAEKSEAELQLLDNMDKEIALLESEVAELEKTTCMMARELSAKRKTTAAGLEAAMVKELGSLAFNQPRFSVQWDDVECVADTMKATGWDRGEFFFSANPGETLKPLAKTASGGELSRLMLAMKCLLAKKDMVETVIFDEVDAGIGGEAAEAVARKIQELAGHHQVFCITHLPQIAARGGLHFQVVKVIDGGRTQTRVDRLSNNKRVEELVRMLAGDSATEQTRAWAEDLLCKGREAVDA